MYNKIYTQKLQVVTESVLIPTINNTIKYPDLETSEIRLLQKSLKHVPQQTNKQLITKLVNKNTTRVSNVECKKTEFNPILNEFVENKYITLMNHKIQFPRGLVAPIINSIPNQQTEGSLRNIYNKLLLQKFMMLQEDKSNTIVICPLEHFCKQLNKTLDKAFEIQEPYFTIANIKHKLLRLYQQWREQISDHKRNCIQYYAKLKIQEKNDNNSFILDIDPLIENSIRKKSEYCDPYKGIRNLNTITVNDEQHIRWDHYFELMYNSIHRKTQLCKVNTKFKAKNNKLRPIINTAESSTWHLSKFVNNILQYATIKLYDIHPDLPIIRDTFDLVYNIDQINWQNIYVYKTDFDSYYTSINNTNIRKAIKWLLDETNLNHLTELILTIFNFEKQCLVIKRNNRLYAMGKGLAMGSCDSPILAIITSLWGELKCIKENKISKLKIREIELQFNSNNYKNNALELITKFQFKWYRFVDDGILFTNYPIIEKTCNYIIDNLSLPELTYDVTICEIQKPMQFLDLGIIKKSHQRCDLEYKPKAKWISKQFYVTEDANLPKYMHHSAIIKSICFRLKTLCDSPKTLLSVLPEYITRFNCNKIPINDLYKLYLQALHNPSEIRKFKLNQINRIRLKTNGRYRISGNLFFSKNPIKIKPPTKSDDNTFIVPEFSKRHAKFTSLYQKLKNYAGVDELFYSVNKKIGVQMRILNSQSHKIVQDILLPEDCNIQETIQFLISKQARKIKTTHNYKCRKIKKLLGIESLCMQTKLKVAPEFQMKIFEVQQPELVVHPTFRFNNFRITPHVIPLAALNSIQTQILAETIHEIYNLIDSNKFINISTREIMQQTFAPSKPAEGDWQSITSNKPNELMISLPEHIFLFNKALRTRLRLRQHLQTHPLDNQVQTEQEISPAKLFRLINKNYQLNPIENITRPLRVSKPIIGSYGFLQSIQKHCFGFDDAILKHFQNNIAKLTGESRTEMIIRLKSYINNENMRL